MSVILRYKEYVPTGKVDKSTWVEIKIVPSSGNQFLGSAVVNTNEFELFELIKSNWTSLARKGEANPTFFKLKATSQMEPWRVTVEFNKTNL